MSAPVSHAPGRHYEVRGHQLWVEAEGDGEPLVLLAGLGPAGSHVIFHPFFSGLDRALYPRLQRQFTDYAPQVRLEFMERSGSFSHVEEPDAVFALIREFTGHDK